MAPSLLGRGHWRVRPRPPCASAASRETTPPQRAGGLPRPTYAAHRYEVVGVVEQTGPGVRAVQVGQRVTVEPTLVCGGCKQCRQGRENLCENLRFFGCGHDQGGMAELFTVAASRLHVVPEGLSDQQAALIEPLATPVHAVASPAPTGAT